MTYALLKLLHLGSLIFWLGPSLGAWLVLKWSEQGQEYSPTNSTAVKVSQAFFWMIVLEHIAFAMLLLSGYWMASEYGFLQSAWLSQKLWIIGLIIIPMEVVDILLGNWVAAEASRKLYCGEQVEPWKLRGLTFYHGSFTRFALVVIPLTVFVVMYLAVAKLPLPLSHVSG